MILSVYEPLSFDDDTLIGTNVANFVEFEKYEYHKYWRDIGSFTLVLPASANGISYVRPDMILFVDEGGQGNTNDSLIITGMENDGLRVTLTGTDLKGLLSYRVTMFPQKEIDAGTYGHDVRQGSTGSIIAGYITYNCIDAADRDRNIPGLRIGNASGGIPNDTYMSRLQPLNEVVTALCKNADIGWDISFSPSNLSGGYVFDIIEGVDRTNATGRYKCVFAEYLHNAEAITQQEKTAERRNVIWTVNGSDVDKAVVTSIYKQDRSVARGFARRETVMTANCDIDLTELYVESRSADMVDKMQVSLRLADPTMYGSTFTIGDKVTVMKGGVGYDRRIIEVQKSYTSGEKSVAIQLGDIPAKKFFDRTSGDLSSRADDVKELALENAATKKTAADGASPRIHFCFGDPNLKSRFAEEVRINAKEGDLCFALENEQGAYSSTDAFVVSIYRYALNPDLSDEDEKENEDGATAPSQKAQANTASISALSDDRSVVKISVQSEPEKTEYRRGEALDLTGGTILVTFSDGNITTVDMTDPGVTVSGYNAQKDGEQTVTLLFGGQTATIIVSVEMYQWEVVGRTMSFEDVVLELRRLKRVTNGDWGGI
ncbi:MAG: bacterial Ig-like domain-containing protein [Bacteroides sp.]|nr:bacterial Ig-like domain-containing protein [Eubacterium sp.]MCM1419523.1 bacterial Ig-like domain-containing protein [Roseburia sp.]MCM1463453.1 bacterial Ig-like domain-containing protein [Bacteroides sp.]